MNMLYEDALILKSEKYQTEKLKKIIALIGKLQKDMGENFDLETQSEDGLPKHEYDLSNLILNIKEIEKLVYIEKLRVLEKAVESESRNTNGSR
jgi:hypothetical protein